MPPDALRAWTEHLARREITAVGGGLLVLRRARRAAAPIRVLRKAPRTTPGPLGGALARWIDGHSLVAELDDESALLDVALSPAPELERVHRARPTGDGWNSTSQHLRVGAGLCFESDVDPVSAEIVGLLGNGRTPRDALAVFAERHGVSVDPFVGGLPTALAKLLETGVLTPG